MWRAVSLPAYAPVHVTDRQMKYSRRSREKTKEEKLKAAKQQINNS